jgi:hypothetical protein
MSDRELTKSELDTLRTIRLGFRLSRTRPDPTMIARLIELGMTTGPEPEDITELGRSVIKFYSPTDLGRPVKKLDG